MRALVEWLEGTALHEALLAGWAIPTIQTVHILAVAIVMGSVLMIGLRIMRLAGTGESVADTADRFVPWVWSALAVLLLSGTLLVVAEPPRELFNILFWTKMVLVLVGVGVTAWFQTSLRRDAGFWDEAGAGTRISLAGLTFLLWVAIAFAGRWIAYLENLPFLPQQIFT